MSTQTPFLRSSKLILDKKKTSYQSLSQEVPLQETGILRIIVIFISDPNLDPEEGLRLLLGLTERAAVLHAKVSERRQQSFALQLTLDSQSCPQRLRHWEQERRTFSR